VPIGWRVQFLISLYYIMGNCVVKQPETWQIYPGLDEIHDINVESKCKGNPCHHVCFIHRKNGTMNYVINMDGRDIYQILLYLNKDIPSEFDKFNKVIYTKFGF
jgi:hypothetical protein